MNAEIGNSGVNSTSLPSQLPKQPQTQVPQASLVPPCTPRESEAALVHALKESLTMTRLPAPEPFIFTGDPLKFTEWSTCFRALIETSCSDPAHRLFYLKKYIDGEALCVLEGTFYRSDTSIHPVLGRSEQTLWPPFPSPKSIQGKVE